MDKRIKFSISKVELIKEVDDAKFAMVKLYAFKTGNNSHMITADEKTLKEYGDTILQCPLVCYYNKFTGDLAGHEIEELPVGYIPENAKISYEKDSNGDTWLIVEALIWKLYSGKVLELFANSDDEKPVSVELVVLESEETNNEEKMLAFAFCAVTILGSAIRPSVPNAKAEVIKYQQDKLEYEEFHNNEKEDNSVTLNSIEELCEKFEITYGELSEKLYMACGKEKFKIEEDYEISRYYMRDFSMSMIYVEDRKEDNYKALPYVVENGKANVNFEEAKIARRVWSVEEIEDKEMDDAVIVELAKESIAKDSSVADIKEYSLYLEKEDPKVVFERLENDKSTILLDKETLEKDLNELKETYSTLELQNQELNIFKQSAIDERIKREFEERDSTISYIAKEIKESVDDMPDEVYAEWINKGKCYSENEAWAKYENIDVWKAEFKSAAFDYLSKHDFSDNNKQKRYGIPDVVTIKVKHNKTADIWHDIRNN